MASPTSHRSDGGAATCRRNRRVTGPAGDAAVRPHRRTAGSLIAALTITTLAGCTTTATRTPAPHAPTPSPPAATAPPRTPPPVITTTLASCAAPVTRTALHVVHHFSVSPDDIAVDSSGRLWVSAREAGQLISLNPDGSAAATTSVSGGPEGVAVAGSAVYVAQQNLNAVEQVTPQRREVVAFPNRTANAGIDGISTGLTSQTLLIPDSPNGTLLELSLTGRPSSRLIATHLGRPVSAAVGPSGDIFVASESTPGLVRVMTGGTVARIGAFTDLDEVLAYAGLLYVTELNRHDVLAVDPTSGASVPLAVNLPAPQGLTVTADGILEIVDATTNALYSLPACGVR
jgi:glucose/arabinose dehydrogenase